MPFDQIHIKSKSCMNMKFHENGGAAIVRPKEEDGKEWKGQKMCNNLTTVVYTRLRLPPCQQPKWDVCGIILSWSINNIERSCDQPSHHFQNFCLVSCTRGGLAVSRFEFPFYCRLFISKFQLQLHACLFCHAWRTHPHKICEIWKYITCTSHGLSVNKKEVLPERWQESHATSRT